ncbi:hypothetical protein LPB136_12480 [Tenacibaculum todarodis]|uniref:SnoaL-like domain-containing protein n=1 Tax=Tenacibaculum todarodis TaxID=1850252 RepID=A0A1L3JLU6_9FLAO|nr:nuclear transport factor 2 family protein [Tenacibaculum todarodis]APG66136.1 hypothetical protein LPB136_12480 [Tenacibaculum todarodis]
MKKMFLTILFLSLMSACKKEQTTDNSEYTKLTKQQINNTVNNWHKAASEANFENYFNIMDNISVFIGTDASENWSKSEFSKFSKPYFDKGKAWSFQTLERNIYVNENKDFAWFDELLNTWMGVSRGSGVLEKKGNNWKLKHYVLSVTVPNDNINQVININKVKDSLFLTTKFKDSIKK